MSSAFCEERLPSGGGDTEPEGSSVEGGRLCGGGTQQGTQKTRGLHIAKFRVRAAPETIREINTVQQIAAQSELEPTQEAHRKAHIPEGVAEVFAVFFKLAKVVALRGKGKTLAAGIQRPNLSQEGTICDPASTAFPPVPSRCNLHPGALASPRQRWPLWWACF